VRFFTGLHQPSDARHFDAAFVSANRLRDRVGAFEVGDWIMDSGGYTEIATHGRYRHDVESYAAQIRRWSSCGNLLAAVAQDWTCDPDSVVRTGLSVAEHQRLTIERYDALLATDLRGVYLMPVLQGASPSDYAAHVAAYGARLAHSAWVCVGSLVHISNDAGAVAAVLHAIKKLRPDLRLHGLGLKTAALSHPLVTGLLESADSMAWSRAARREGRNANDWREAKAWTERIARLPVQGLLDILMEATPC
jgi:hypothetical protein